MKKISLGVLALFIGISFTGCTLTPEEQAAYNAREQQRAQCKMQYRNCIVYNSNGRDMSNIHTAMNVTNYCKQATCY